MIRCPEGHESAAEDYCDTCGIRIGTVGGSGSGPTVAVAPGPVAPEVSPGDCTNCGTARAGSERFCEICGLDFDTGAMPAAPVVTPASPPTPAGTSLVSPGTASSPPLAVLPPGIGWIVVVSCDRQWWEHNSGAGGVADGVPYPEPEPQPRRVELRAAQSVIGRTSGSRVPDIDCGTLDTGVSRRHARLTLQDSGQWTVSDLGSTNGTYVGAVETRLDTGVETEVGTSTAIKLGAFTVLRIEPVTPPGP